MNRSVFLSGMLCMSFFVAKAQEGHVHWQHTFGGTHDEGAHSISHNHSSGYILYGSSISGPSSTKTDTCRGSYDMWLVNTDPDGEVIWDKTFGTGTADQGFSVIATSDGGFLVSGERSMNIIDWGNPGFMGDADDTLRGFIDCWTLKLDADGEIEWQKTFGGLWFDRINEVKEVADGYVMLCHSDSPVSSEKEDSCRDVDPCLGCPIGDLWLLKLNMDGEIEWQKTIGGDRGDEPAGILVTRSGKIIVGASSYSRSSGEKTDSCRDDGAFNSVFDYWIMAIDGNNGNIQWQQTIGGNRMDWLKSVVETEDGHYLLAGWSASDSMGEKTSASRDSLYLAESSYLNGGDFWFVKIDTLGNIVNQKSIGGDKEDMLTKLIPVPGGYYAIGSSNSGISYDKSEICRSEGNGMPFLMHDIWILKLDTDMNIIWQKTIGCKENDLARDAVYNAADSSLLVLAVSNSGTCADKTAGNYGGYDYWMLKISEREATHIQDAIPTDAAMVLFPNPSSGLLNVTAPAGSLRGSLFIYDMVGKVRYTGAIKSGTAQIDIGHLQDGQYILRLEDGKAVYHRFFTLIRQ